MGVQLVKVPGLQTSQHRKARGFAKSSDKLAYIWEAHNSDSHSIAEMALDVEVEPKDRSFCRINFLEFYKRMLHRQKPKKGGKRTPYGSTRSLDISRGAVAIWADKKKKTKQIVYIGGCTKGQVEVCSIERGKRIKQKVKRDTIKVLCDSKQRAQYVYEAA